MNGRVDVWDLGLIGVRNKCSEAVGVLVDGWRILKGIEGLVGGDLEEGEGVG